MHLRTQKFHKKIGVYLYVLLFSAIMNILPYKSIAGTTITQTFNLIKGWNAIFFRSLS
jgi:hypothetical protein